MSFRLDCRAAELADRGAKYPGGHLLTTEVLAAWCAMSPPIATRMRAEGIGPQVTPLSPQRLPYRNSYVVAGSKCAAALAESTIVAYGSSTVPDNTTEPRCPCARAPAVEGAR
jgi:hypothetical protein